MGSNVTQKHCESIMTGCLPNLAMCQQKEWKRRRKKDNGNEPLKHVNNYVVGIGRDVGVYELDNAYLAVFLLEREEKQLVKIIVKT